MNITPQIIRTYNLTQLTQLCQKIREKIISTTLLRGGHLAPSLGVVELTVALHYVFDTPYDKIIWDVGHQAYAHKLITGRWEKFDSLRTLGGIAGFPRTAESEYDVFNTGHSGNSISVALGIATANRLKGEKQKVIAVIGDGSIVTGMAFEALNNAGSSKEDLIVVLNDNEFSIGRTTGAMAKYLNRIITGRIYNRLKADTWNLLGMLPQNLSDKARIAARKLESGLKNLVAPSIIFEELGFRYLGPFDGHNLTILLEQFQKIKSMKGPLLVHIITKKGKGYAPAEKEPEKYHGIGPMMEAKRNTLNAKCNTPARNGQARIGQARNGQDVKRSVGMSEMFGKTLCNLAQNDNRIIAISAGMCLGTGLTEFQRQFPDRFFDVGISEQHAITFASGLALAGLRPVVAVYSTFLCRGYDQLIQDVALQNLPVVIAIDRAGLVGEDGETHHGMFDLSYLRTIPNLVVMAPADETELALMLEFALHLNQPVAIRYPKNQMNPNILPKPRKAIELGKSEIIYEQIYPHQERSKTITILAIGSMVLNAYSAIELGLKQDPELYSQWRIVLVNTRFVKPLDKELILKSAQESEIIITIEENSLTGGFGSGVLELINQKSSAKPQFLMLGLPDRFISHGSREQLLDECGLSVVKLKDSIKKMLNQK